VDFLGGWIGWLYVHGMEEQFRFPPPDLQALFCAIYGGES
jgi:hypothetical protein